MQENSDGGRDPNNPHQLRMRYPRGISLATRRQGHVVSIAWHVPEHMTQLLDLSLNINLCLIF